MRTTTDLDLAPKLPERTLQGIRAMTTAHDSAIVLIDARGHGYGPFEADDPELRYADFGRRVN